MGSLQTEKINNTIWVRNRKRLRRLSSKVKVKFQTEKMKERVFGRQKRVKRRWSMKNMEMNTKQKRLATRVKRSIKV